MVELCAAMHIALYNKDDCSTLCRLLFPPQICGSSTPYRTLCRLLFSLQIYNMCFRPKCHFGSLSGQGGKGGFPDYGQVVAGIFFIKSTSFLIYATISFLIIPGWILYRSQISYFYIWTKVNKIKVSQ
jgi:hypothetical protein